MSVLAVIFRKTGGIVFILVALTMASSCTYLSQELPSLPNQGMPVSVTITSVPFYPQQAYQCGPAALAMVLSWSQAKVTPQDLVPLLFTPARHGTMQPALISTTRSQNRLAYPIEGIDALLQEIAAGHPVIVLQNLGFGWFPRWHYAVVIGYDFTKKTVTLHSGKEPRRVINWELFVRTWKRAQNWGLVILPTTQLPASASEKSYLAAVLGLEQAEQWEGAFNAYTAALARWHQSLGAIMGLGNSHYAMGNLIMAEQAFRQATRLHPQSGAAFNNLAHVLADQGRYPEAIQMARQAVFLGGTNEPLYRQTLYEIELLQLRDH
jgi:hypothetical protein